MTQPSSTQAPPAQDQTVQHIVEILAAYLAAQKTLDLLTNLLAPVGITGKAVQAAFRVAGHRRPRRRSRQGVTSLRPDRTPALNATLAGEDTYRAAFLLASARRMQAAADRARRENRDETEAVDQAERAERTFFAQHQAAQYRRREVAGRVDLAAQRFGPLVGWHATLDDRTDPACRQAHGANFRPALPPVIGWPGSVHPACRCKPGRPFATTRLLSPRSQAA